ncbi:MAG: metalloregulator ArsR/SmtB family transcription factor [Caldilineaceae bacterium]
MTLGAVMVPMPPTVEVTVALEPVYNNLMSMAALRDPEEYGGIAEWALQTAARLDEPLRRRHQFWMKWLWLDALTNAVDRGPATATFPAYLDALATQDATTLRNRLLDGLVNSVHLRLYSGAQPVPTVEPATLLTDIAHFSNFLLARFVEKPAFEDLHDLPAFHALLNEPQQLQTELVDDLRTLWDQVVAAEWARLAPHLQSCVDAFSVHTFRNQTMLDAIQTVTGRDLRSIFRLDELWRYRRVRFIPTIHNGPYIVWFGNDEELRIGFPAYLPSTSAFSGPQFDQSTLVNRYKALADETRLAILWALRERGQLSTQEVIDRFMLDKSAASRHLRQLVATNLIEEQREDGAKKVYQLNPRTIDELMRMLSSLR